MNSPVREIIRSNSGGHDEETAALNQFKDRLVASSSSLSLQAQGRRCSHRFIEWIQRQPVPKALVRRCRSFLPMEKGENEVVYCFSGIDAVLFGTLPAADVVVVAGVKPPRYLWYMVSGFVCDMIQFSMDLLLHFVLHIEDASVCWALGFFLSVVFRHTSHRYFVFGDYVGGYWHSLARMYAAYSIIIVLSTLFNILMTKVATLSHYLAWILTLLWTGIANYFILKRIWTFGGTPIGNKGSSTSSSSVSTGSSD